MHNFTVVRSVNHRVSMHNSAAYYSLTGHTPLVDSVSATASASDFPAYGSVVSKLAPSQTRVAHVRRAPLDDRRRRLPHAGRVRGLSGQGARPPVRHQGPELPELLGRGADPADRGAAGAGLVPSALRSGLAAYSRLDDSIAAVRGLDAYQQKALSLLTSSETRRAFDIQSRDPRLRDRYGRTPYGQGVLMARRLVEAGVRFVTVYYSPGIVGWDTHSDNFNLLRRKLLPATEQTLPTLIEDLASRGMLDDTLVVWTGEFGRTPKINKDAGRDHWPQCYTLLMAGGGMKRGFVYGASDSTAAYPKDDPCTPDDISATMFYCMGIDPATELRNHVDQPIPVSRGTPIMPLLA